MKIPFKAKSNIIGTITVLYICLFLYTGIDKLLDFENFKEQIAFSPFLTSWAKIVARLVPMIELLITVLLIVPRWRMKGLWGALVLMVIFTAYILFISLYNDKLPCSCGGIIQLLSWNQHLVFNTIFIGLAVIGVNLLKNIENRTSIPITPQLSA